MSSASLRVTPAYAPVSGAPGEGVSLSELGRQLRRRWRAVAVPTVVACLGAVAFVQIVSPRYTGETKVLLESRDSAFTRPTQERTDQPQPIDEQAVASQALVVASRDVAREAIKRLNLVGNPEFDPAVGGIGPVQRVLMAMGLVPNVLDRDPVDRVLERYFDHLVVYPAGKSRILTVEFRAKDPDLAAKGANTVADLYLASLEAAKVDTARYASTWLSSNIDTLRSRLAEAEGKVEAFRARNGLLGGGATSQPLGTQQLTELSTQLIQARGAQADAAAKARLIKDLLKDGRAFDIPDVANNEMIRRLVEQRITLRAQLALESRTLLPGHPRIKELTAQVTDLETQIRAAGDRTVRTLESDARIAGARVESLQAAVEGQSGVVAKANTDEVQLRALDREARAQRDQLESYLSRYREAAARDAESAAPPDARVVSRAVVSDTPSFPKKLPIVAFTTIVAFLFAAGAVAARELLKGPVAPSSHGEATPLVPATVEPVQRRPVVALRQAPERMDVPAPLPEAAASAFAAAPAPAAARPGVIANDEEALPFDLAPLVARIEAIPTRGNAGRRLLLVGAEPSGSLEALAEALGTQLSGRGRTLMVSLDGASQDGHPGLTDVILGEAAFLEAIQSRPRSRMHRIGPGRVDGGVLSEEQQGLVITLDALAQAYEWVICRLGQGAGKLGGALIDQVAPLSDAVVIASNAPPEDPALVALYERAKAAGSAEVMVAQDKAEEAPATASPPLRRSA